VCNYRLGRFRVLLATCVKADPAALLASAELLGLLSTRAAAEAALLDVVSLRVEGFVMAMGFPINEGLTVGRTYLRPTFFIRSRMTSDLVATASADTHVLSG
jgi:hypothetical protein